MRALVLCGGIPQAALIEELKSRGIYTILADMNPHVMARPLADEFYPVRFFFGDTLGSYYIIIGIGVLIVSLILSFSKYGNIVLGEQNEKPHPHFNRRDSAG